MEKPAKTTVDATSLQSFKDLMLERQKMVSKLALNSGTTLVA